MGTRAVKAGGGRWKAVEAGIVGTALAAAVVGVPHLHRPDIHAEYVRFPSGKDTVTAYLAHPERKDRAPAVLVIHEIFGMSDFIRHATEQLAQDGFVAIAPDLLSRRAGRPRPPTRPGSSSRRSTPTPSQRIS